MLPVSSAALWFPLCAILTFNPVPEGGAGGKKKKLSELMSLLKVS